jgi:integrase/recombinase XerC
VKGAPALPVPTEATELLRLHRLAQDRRGIQPNSIEKREQYLRAFARWLDPRGLLDASRQDVELFLDKRRTQEGRKIQSDTRYYWIAHFHSFYKWAMLEELIEADPTVAIVRPKTRRTLPHPIEGDDLVMAVRGARPEMRAMLSLAAFAGLRCQEIAGLDRDDIIEAKGLIRVRYGKGAKERIVPLHPDVMEALRCLPLPRTGALFVRPRRGRYSPNWMSACIGRYLHEMGINASAHQCRHWFATEIYAATHDIRITQELLGHSDPATTAGYIA